MGVLYNAVCSCLNKLVSVQEEDHSAFCRSEASILFQLIHCARRINSYTNEGKKNYNNHIITVYINDKSATTDVYFSLFLINISLPSPTLFISPPIHLHTLEIYKLPPPPCPPPPPLTAISVVLPESVRQVRAFLWDDCVTDRGLWAGGKGWRAEGLKGSLFLFPLLSPTAGWCNWIRQASILKEFQESVWQI